MARLEKMIKTANIDFQNHVMKVTYGDGVQLDDGGALFMNGQSVSISGDQFNNIFNFNNLGAMLLDLCNVCLELNNIEGITASDTAKTQYESLFVEE